MDRPARVATLGAPASLVDALRALPSRPEVRVWPSLYADLQSLTGFRPEVLFAAVGSDPAEDAGAMRCLQAVLPGVTTVLAGQAADEVRLQPLAQRSGSLLLLLPPAPGALAAVLEAALHGSNRPREDAFLDLARGIADEINNPLLFIAGYLQLLRSTLAASDQSRLDQLDAAAAGIQRLQATVDRVQLVARAASGRLQLQPVDCRSILQQALPPSAGLAWREELDGGGAVVHGDAELLGAAITAFVQVAQELRLLEPGVELELARTPGSLRLRLLARGRDFAGFRLPRTFEPYYINRVLRGGSHGLALFLAQTVVHAHGGQATARRQPDGSIAVDLLLPA